MHPEVELLGAIGGMKKELLPSAVRRWLMRSPSIPRYGQNGDWSCGVHSTPVTRWWPWCTNTGRGKGSGVTVEADIALVYGFRDSKAAWIEPYMSQAEALEAAGLRE